MGGYLNDESSFLPQAGECYNEALSAVEEEDHLQPFGRPRVGMQTLAMTLFTGG